MIKIGICEDDMICRASIGKMLGRYFKENDTGFRIREYESGDCFMERNESADILILDIEMEGTTGIELKDWLCEVEEDVKILFVTNHMEAMSEAFGRNVYGFLRKPVEQKELEKYLRRMQEDIQENRKLVVKGIDKEFVVKMKDILYFESSDKYSHVVLENDRYFSDKGLRQWEENLRDSYFFRCHRCYLVNFRNIHRMDNDIYMCNGDKLPIGRRRAKVLKDSYRKYIIRKAR
ncbi:MAG: response regulator transcription factor [Lachnospiraceae bacterium]|nr:response regulator transcription factor [Lachnospiraceae bacterium]